MIVHAEPTCPSGHYLGQLGQAEGDSSRVTGVGECVTVVFERESRTAMLLTSSDRNTRG